MSSGVERTLRRFLEDRGSRTGERTTVAIDKADLIRLTVLADRLALPKGKTVGLAISVLEAALIDLEHD